MHFINYKCVIICKNYFFQIKIFSIFNIIICNKYLHYRLNATTKEAPRPPILISLKPFKQATTDSVCFIESINYKYIHNREGVLSFRSAVPYEEGSIGFPRQDPEGFFPRDVLQEPEGFVVMGKGFVVLHESAFSEIRWETLELITVKMNICLDTQI